MIYEDNEGIHLQSIKSGSRDHQLDRMEQFYTRLVENATETPVTEYVKMERRLSWIRDRRACLGREAVCGWDTLESQFGELVARAANYHDKPHQLYSKLAVMIKQFYHPEEEDTLAYDNMMRQYEEVGPQKVAAREVERLREVVRTRDTTVESLSERIHELEDEVACLRQALEPGPGPGVNEPGFVRIGRMDDANRRSLWLREGGDTEIELRAGREGYDARVVLRPSQWDKGQDHYVANEWVVPSNLYRALSDLFSRARFAVDNIYPQGYLESEYAGIQKELGALSDQYADLADREFAGQQRITELEIQNEVLTDRLFTEEMRRYLESEQDPGDES